MQINTDQDTAIVDAITFAKTVPASSEPSPFWTEARDHKLINAAGRQREIARLAERWGVEITTVKARWFVLRGQQ